ncbi:hypothetical protein JAAARDRAFT_193325 [Jaapia argillacea MUCL 33604]|uniref:Magnesium transporter n=1 Tax=Jaapia argillacea MUCL 33604 TaxID=933084 RepID=A0A067Q889_9AGAM|nr:hypothetical protein JAAARDRAFT_193325 [Jaapia argillacea MUCL 33604]
MPRGSRENSFSDFGGRLLTRNLDKEEVELPVEKGRRTLPHAHHFTPEMENLEQYRSTLPVMPTGAPRQPTTPKDKFRPSVRKVMHMRSIVTPPSGRGADPGADPRHHSTVLTYGHLREKCAIEVIDYSITSMDVRTVTNSELVEFLEGSSTRDPWVKVRWINVGGISWDVISALTLKYDLHPLAVEDILHQRGHVSSKADYYSQHLFLRILCHSIRHGAESNGSAHTDPSLVNDGCDKDRTLSGHSKPQYDRDYYSPLGTRLSANTRIRSLSPSFRLKHPPTIDLDTVEAGIWKTPANNEASRRALKQQHMQIVVQELKRGGYVPVNTSPICIFLLRDGTVISINQTPSNDLTTPITARLRDPDSTLRVSADASLLVESLLDLIVDSALEIVDEYQDKLLKLEQQVLIKPKMKTVQYLHTISGDMTAYKRSLEPLRTLIYSLRRYDLDHCATLIDPSKSPRVKVRGFMSYKSKIYLAGVSDHMEYILSSLDMFGHISENLIDYTFNMTSYQTNQAMRRLTMATVTFLPLTFLAGYFGMNFATFWSVQNHSDLFFWAIAIPYIATLVVIFGWTDFLPSKFDLRSRAKFPLMRLSPS